MELRTRVAGLLGPDWTEATLTLEGDAPGPAEGLRRLTFTTREGEAVPALYRPSDTGAAVLYCHAHGNRPDIGIDELHQGRPALGAPYLPDLAALGLGTLCLEMPTFGSRAEPAESALAKARLWHGRTLFGQMLGEQRAARDWLATAPGVDPGRIGVMGVSMGGTLAWWLAAMAGGFAAAASVVCFADLGMLVQTGAHDGHGSYMTVPGLLPLTSTGTLCGLAAPTPMLHCAGFRDWSTPEPAFRRAEAELRAAYRGAGAEGAVSVLTDPASGHVETPAMRRAVLDHLAAHLGSGAAENG